MENAISHCIHRHVYMRLLQMSGQTDLSLEEFEQENYNFEELESIARDDSKVKFLIILSTSDQLIEWLQMETKGIRYTYLCMHLYYFCLYRC